MSSSTLRATYLTPGQQAAFEDYFFDGGGFVGIHSAIETEPDWGFLTDIIGTRANGSSPVTEATIKVADRVHVASESLPEYWERTDQWYNFTSNVRGKQHVLATVDESTYAGGTMGFDHPITWCQDYKGGRSFYTAGGDTVGSFAEPEFRNHLAGAIQWAAGVGDGDCGATVLANYQFTPVTTQPNLNEPIGFDVLPDGRVIQTDRRGGVRLHDPVTNTTTLIAQIPVYMASEDGMYGPAVDKAVRHQQMGVPLLLTADDGAAVSRDDPDGQRAQHRRRPVCVGPVARLLPAVAVQVRGRDRVAAGTPGPRQ